MVQVAHAKCASLAELHASSLKAVLPFLATLALSSRLHCRKLATDSVLVGILEVLSNMDATTAKPHCEALLSMMWDMQSAQSPGAAKSPGLP